MELIKNGGLIRSDLKKFKFRNFITNEKDERVSRFFKRVGIKVYVFNGISQEIRFPKFNKISEIIGSKKSIDIGTVKK